MAAYGAASSLKITIYRILQSSRFIGVSPSPQILQPAYEAMDRLQRILVQLDDTSYSKIRTEVNALDERIKEAVWKFEDILESHLFDQILPQLESSGVDLSFSVDLQSLQHHVDFLVATVRKMEVEYLIEVANMPEEVCEPISSRIDFGGINSTMVGLSDQFEEARDYLLSENEDQGNHYSLVGMAGVGKTTLAKKVLDDPSIQRHFEFRAWVKVGRKCESDETLRCILAQLDLNAYEMLSQGEDVDQEKLVGLLEERLKGTKCLVVLDDVWDRRLMDDLPKKNVRILFTSRLGMIEFPTQVVRLLNEEESKELLGEKVFGEEGFPPHLKELGEKIATKCDGLPLMIVTVAELLSKAEKTTKYWKQVARQHSSVFEEAYDHVSQVLLPSYDYLPQYLKMLFLYMGAFPHGNIAPCYLEYLLSADGFLEPTGEQAFRELLVKCLVQLVHWYHLVLFEPNPESYFLLGIWCRVHSCWQHLCKKEASKIKFLHVLQSCNDVIKDQRRLCAHCNTLFCFKQVYDSIKGDCSSTARSLLCFGPYHQYPVPINAMGFKLLKVLDAFRVRFYRFPLEILKLVFLHYLSLTCNGDLPASISNLFHLQFLLIGRHMAIKKRGAQSYMPVEIWDMQELKVINIFGRDLPTPNSNATLNKLSELVGVSAKSCTREVLKRIPNLKILEIQVELKPYDDYEDDDSNPLSGLGYISEELQNLDLLDCCVVNPEMKHESMIPLSMFPSSLITLELSGIGCPWKYMNDIGSQLPNLESLILKHYAFRGPEWDIESGCFMKLETLVIEDTDLVRWRPQQGSFPNLEFLCMRHCYRLQQLDWTCDRSLITTIKLIDCNPLAVTSAKQLTPKSLFRVNVDSSFLK